MEAVGRIFGARTYGGRDHECHESILLGFPGKHVCRDSPPLQVLSRRRRFAFKIPEPWVLDYSTTPRLSRRRFGSRLRGADASSRVSSGCHHATRDTSAIPAPFRLADKSQISRKPHQYHTSHKASGACLDPRAAPQTRRDSSEVAVRACAAASSLPASASPAGQSLPHSVRRML